MCFPYKNALGKAHEQVIRLARGLYVFYYFVIIRKTGFIGSVFTKLKLVFNQTEQPENIPARSLTEVLRNIARFFPEKINIYRKTEC